MTTWTLDQIKEAASLRSSRVVPVEKIAALDAQVFVDETVRDLIREGQERGLEIHEDDTWFITEDHQGVSATVRITARWRPETEKVELFGGSALDGTMIAVKDAPFKELVTEAFSDPTDADVVDPDTSIHTDKVVWFCSGWNERGRHWVYTNK